MRLWERKKKFSYFNAVFTEQTFSTANNSFYRAIPEHWHLFLLLIMHNKKVSKTLRMMVNAKAPLKKYTGTRESTSSVARQTPGDITKI